MTTTFASHHQNNNTFKSGKSSSIVTRRQGSTSSFTSQKLARKSRRTLKVNASSVEKLRFLSPQEVKQVREEFGTPVYVYDLQTLKNQATSAKAFPNAYG